MQRISLSNSIACTCTSNYVLQSTEYDFTVLVRERKLLFFSLIDDRFILMPFRPSCDVALKTHFNQTSVGFLVLFGCDESVGGSVY